MDNRNLQQQGFTIVEILISLVVGLGLLLGVLSIFVSMHRTTEETTSYGELQENGRFAISLLTDDLLRQSFWGDLPEQLDTSLLISSPDPATLGGDCVGAGANNASFPTAVGHFRTLWAVTATAANNMGCINNAKVNSDILQVKRALSVQTLPANVQADRYYLISNSNTGAVFAGSAAIPNVNFGSIWEYQHHIYYVREETQGTNTVPVLVQGTLQNSAASAMNLSMVVEGIEHVHYMFGVDTNNSGTVNAFISADNMLEAHWDNESNVRILAVKVYVLARDIFPDSQYENLNTYQLGDKTLTFTDGLGNGDNYRRLLFSSTVTLHNARVDSWP
ncbi:PilW family protein [Thalassotalea fusca]